MQDPEASEVLARFGAHPKYGALVTAAVTNWMSYGLRPAVHVWGLAAMEGATGAVVYGPRRQDHDCACLVGAALLGRIACASVGDAAMREFGLAPAEFRGVVSGFDRNPRGRGEPGYDVGLAISEILHKDTDKPADL